MNLMLTKLQKPKLSSWWLLPCYLSMLPFGFLFFHDGWYGIGWGKLVGPLIVLGILIGSASVVHVAWKGSWWQRLGVLPAMLFFGNILIATLIDVFR